MDPYLSMAAFALASSITPGPVNLVALNCGARFGFRASARHITGATVGFTLLLLLIGLGLYELLERAPILMRGIQWGGVAFLLYMFRDRVQFLKVEAADHDALDFTDAHPSEIPMADENFTHVLRNDGTIPQLNECLRRARWEGDGREPGYRIRCGEVPVAVA